ncbi:hypothetical protein [Brachybacterium sp. GCM10030252]|uniref:hypothetical protein n=1 Tax=Brachybacterium sp. GCM10030252 TaxID=3273380 RepID=UPI003618BC5D
MSVKRRYLFLGGVLGLFSPLTGCGFLGPTEDDVNVAIKRAPGVTGADIHHGQAGSFRSKISGTVALDVTTDELHDAFDEVWRRGVEVLHRLYDGDRGIRVADVIASNAVDATVSSRDLVELGESRHPTLGHFYDHYGIA